jgi:hypothetical protein
VAGPSTALLGTLSSRASALSPAVDAASVDSSAALLRARARRASARCATPDRVPLLLAKDMTGKHAGLMHGVPSTYNWAAGPRVDIGNHPGHYTAVSAWGQVYEWAEGSPATNVRVACRDIALWILSRSTGQWRRTNASRAVNGANYVEDFVGDVSKPAPLRREPDGSVSSTLGGGWNFHLYSTRARSVIDPGDVGGVVSQYSARVIMDDPNGPDQRAQARYLASAGADYWLDSKVGADDGVTVDPAGCGKARFLTSQWQTLTMSTLGLHKLAQNPPPICIRGR